MSKLYPFFVNSIFSTKDRMRLPFEEFEKKRKEAKARNNKFNLGRHERLVTECFLIDENKNISSYGSTILSPLDYIYDKVSLSIAQRIASGRAVHVLKTKIDKYGPFGTALELTNGIDFATNDILEKISKLNLAKRTPLKLE